LRYKLLLSMSILGVVLGFQNCGQSLRPGNGADAGGASERVIGPASSYNKVVYDPFLEGGPSSGVAGMKRLDLALMDGSLKITDDSTGAVHQCTADADRLTQLRNLLADASVCAPGPLPPGMASCMAIATADIELSNSGDSIQLRRVTCNNGTYLCGGDDPVFRSLLASLRDTPPAGCQ
jgi:hypothetical protein